jgi:diadenosine tetraphosphate (Ap4A) HIT family hydrolase
MRRILGLLRRDFFYGFFIWILNHIPSIIPVKFLRETNTLLAFFHPEPQYSFHVLVLPKKAIRSFFDLEPADPFLSEVITAVQSLVAEHRLTAFRLIVNGGEYQEFPHLNYHLISNAPSKLMSPHEKKRST